MSKFDDFISDVLRGAQGIATGVLTDLAGDVTADTKAFLKQSEAKLKEWTKAFGNGDLTEKQFKALVKGRVTLAKMTAIVEAGIASARIKKLKDDLINLIVGKAIDVFL